jgi:hypothetical protein
MARLDRLGSAKEVAQIGAAIGREFSHALIATVLPKPRPEENSLPARDCTLWRRRNRHRRTRSNTR